MKLKDLFNGTNYNTSIELNTEYHLYIELLNDMGNQTTKLNNDTIVMVELCDSCGNSWLYTETIITLDTQIEELIVIGNKGIKTLLEEEYTGL